MSNYSDSETKIDELQFTLSQLANHLVCNYPLCNYLDEQWDQTTRSLIDDAFAALGRQKVDWDLI